jgi:hypothetical protein
MMLCLGGIKKRISGAVSPYLVGNDLVLSAAGAFLVLLTIANFPTWTHHFPFALTLSILLGTLTSILSVRTQIEKIVLPAHLTNFFVVWLLGSWLTWTFHHQMR